MRRRKSRQTKSTNKALSRSHGGAARRAPNFNNCTTVTCAGADRIWTVMAKTITRNGRTRTPLSTAPESIVRGLKWLLTSKFLIYFLEVRSQRVESVLQIPKSPLLGNMCLTSFRVLLEYKLQTFHPTHDNFTITSNKRHNITCPYAQTTLIIKLRMGYSLPLRKMMRMLQLTPDIEQ